MLLTCVTGYCLQRPFHLKSICTHFEPNERASQAKHEDRFVDYPLHLPLPLAHFLSRSTPTESLICLVLVRLQRRKMRRTGLTLFQQATVENVPENGKLSLSDYLRKRGPYLPLIYTDQFSIKNEHCFRSLMGGEGGCCDVCCPGSLPCGTGASSIGVFESSLWKIGRHKWRLTT